VLAFGQGTPRIRDPVDFGHQPLDQKVGLQEGYHRDRVDWRGRGRPGRSRPFKLFTHTHAANDRFRERRDVILDLLLDVRERTSTGCAGLSRRSMIFTNTATAAHAPGLATAPIIIISDCWRSGSTTCQSVAHRPVVRSNARHASTPLLK
jgi:hypothetical protein